MNKLSKVGLSALCGSLASIASANAGAIDVSGGATMSHTSLSKAVTGNPLGMATNLTFKGSGELDGGQTFSVTIANDDKNVYSSANITLNTNSLGKFVLSQGEGGNGIDGYDDKAPTAWEETTGTGLTIGNDQIGGLGGSTSIAWTSPSVATSTIQLAYAARNDGVKVNDKAVSGATSTKGAAYDIVLDINPQFDLAGINIFAGYHVTDMGGGYDGAASTQKRSADHEEGTAGIILTIGPVQAGFQRSIEHPGNQMIGSTEYYANTNWGVSFNLNDNLSLSYGDYASRKGFVNRGVDPTRYLSAQSWQVAYTMGGASIKIAETDVTNASYANDQTVTGTDSSGTTVALTLAF